MPCACARSIRRNPESSALWNRRSSRSGHRGIGSGAAPQRFGSGARVCVVRGLEVEAIKRSSESRNPSVWRSGRLKTTRSVNAVRTARFEYRRWPPRRPFFGGTHAAIASSLSQIVTSPRLLRPRSYSLQFRILYFFLYWRLTRLDFAATTTLPPDLYDGLDPTPAASVLAYTDSCTNATPMA